MPKYNATYLSKHLQETLHCITRNNEESVPAGLVKLLIKCTLTYIGKTEALAGIQILLHTIGTIKTEVGEAVGALRHSAETMTQAAKTSEHNIKDIKDKRAR
jgi:hypothetical protein